MSGIWDEVKNDIKADLPNKSYSLWINPITLLHEKDRTLILGCPNKFSLNWITANYLGMMREKLVLMGKGHYELILKVQPQERKGVVPDLFRDTKQLILPNIPVHRGNGRRRFNKEFTFDRFVVGQCNEFAYSAAKALAFGGNWPYESLFLLANTGLGKSHLSQSIGQGLLEKNPKIRAYYITAEDFVNEMIYALKTKRIEEFKNRYRRSCDVLLLEEVHFLSGKDQTQVELGHTLDALINDGKKIIFTSSMLPKDIPNMAGELKSRLTSGVITTLERPDYETRVKIIEKKSTEQHMKLSDDIKHLFATHLARDVRQIESALKSLQAKSELLKVRVDLDLAKEVIKNHITDQSCITVKGIGKLICQYFKIEPVMLRSKSRKKIHTYPRNVYVFLCRQNTDATLEEIGRTINRNHTTVLYSSEVIEKMIKVDDKVRKQVDFLNQKLQEVIQ